MKAHHPPKFRLTQVFLDQVSLESFLNRSYTPHLSIEGFCVLPCHPLGAFPHPTAFAFGAFPPGEPSFNKTSSCLRTSSVRPITNLSSRSCPLLRGKENYRSMNESRGKDRAGLCLFGMLNTKRILKRFEKNLKRWETSKSFLI